MWKTEKPGPISLSFISTLIGPGFSPPLGTMVRSAPRSGFFPGAPGFKIFRAHRNLQQNKIALRCQQKWKFL